MIARLRSFISCVVAFSLALSHIPAAADPLSKADYEACQARDETAFRAAIEAISVRALKAGIATAMRSLFGGTVSLVEV